MNKTRFTDYQAYQQWHDATWDHRRDMSERGRYLHLLSDNELTIERVLDHGAIVSDGHKSDYAPFHLLQGHIQKNYDKVEG